MRTLARPERIVYGRILGAGLIGQGSGDFTLIRNGVGDYTILFTPPFKSPPVVTATTHQFSANDFAIVKDTTTERACTIAMVNSSGTQADSNFTFMAVGR